MNQQADQEARPPRYALYLPVLLIGICLLYGWATLAIRPLYDLSQNESLPISINATQTADYSADFYAPVGNVSLNILFDLFQDLDPASVPEDRMATLVGSLQTPVASVTIPAGSTQTDPTAAATLQIETTIVETALTENPVVLIPNTHIPSTSTPIPPPPPPTPPKPTKPPIEEPSTPIPEPVHLSFINPPSDGATITNNADTTFKAEAWDPAIGTNNGDGITSITFKLYDSIGNTIHIYSDLVPSYCIFGGDSSCNDAATAGLVLTSDTYTLEATVLTAAGETKTITRTFIIPAITHLEIIVPPSDGTVITDMNDTKFEAEAWDPTVGIINGDGITSVTFVVYDSLSNLVHTYVDFTPSYCAFGGDSACVPSPAVGVIFTPDNYTLEATVLTDAGGTLTITRTFIIP